MATLFIHKDKILHNLAVLREQTGTLVIPVLSGNAMGLGDFETARLLSDAGVRLFAVSRLEEAKRLASVLPPEAEILLLSPYSTEAAAQQIVDLNLTAAVGSYDSAVLLSGLAERAGVKCRVHLLFDTGLGHYGFLPQEADKAVQAAKYLKNIEVAGCFTELIDPTGRDKKGAFEQLKQFNLCVETLRKADIHPGLTHIAGSAAGLRYPSLRLDAVRVANGLFGNPTAKRKLGLQKVYRLASEVSEVRWLPSGHTVGTDKRYRVKKPIRIAVIPIGYADGVFVEKVKDAFRFRDILRYRRQDFALLFRKEKLMCEIGGKKAPLVGAVGAYAVAADVSDMDCAPGDTVMLDCSSVLVGANVERSYL